MTLRVNEGGSGRDVLLLLHGLGATGDVWQGVGDHWPGRWLAPDLPGHGGSDRLERYTFDEMAREVRRLIAPGDRVTVLGHSLGGVLALGLGAMTDQVREAVGLGIKVVWSPDELARAASLAERPTAWFDSREDALAWHRRVSGMGDLADDATAAAGVVEQNGHWRLALDCRTFGVGAPDMRHLLDQCSAQVVLARGENDPMVSQQQLADLVAQPVSLPGLGHNAHLEDPDRVYGLL